MSIRSKIIGGSISLLFLFISVALYTHFRAGRTNDRLVFVNELFLPLSRDITQLQASLHGFSEDIRRYYFQADLGSEYSTLSRMVRDYYPYLIQKKFGEIDTLLTKQSSSGLHSDVEAFSTEVSDLKRRFDELLATNDKTKFETLFSDLRARLQSFSSRVDDQCQKVTLAAQTEGKEILFTSGILSLLVTAFAVGSILVSHKVLSPLPDLISSVRKIATGSFDESLKVRTTDKDEISLLAREYNRMLAALAERDRQIQGQQRELVKGERLAAIGQLSAEIVHEIRNPLNAISLNIDWLESELEQAGPELKQTLRSVAREIERLNQITESYLVRARLPGEGPKKTDANELLLEILEFTREEDRAAKIEVSTALAEEQILVSSDRSRLKQAFLNVLKNAKESMPRGGRLSVRTAVAENVYRIEITDTGCGMTDKTRFSAFHPFFTTKPNGTGLGMTLTKSIVEEAQGTLDCVSAVGKGTTFTFQFPA